MNFLLNKNLNYSKTLFHASKFLLIGSLFVVLFSGIDCAWNQGQGPIYLNNIIKNVWEEEINETDSTKKLKDYMEFFGLEKQYYSFNYGNVHFTAISTELPYEEGSEQYEFVNNDLSKVLSDPDIDWIVVFFHSLAYTSPADIGKGNRAEKEFRATYHPLFDKYNVDIVLQAHNHNYQRTYPIIFNNDKPKEPIVTDKTDNNNYNFHNPEGQIFVTAGTGGAELYPLTGQADFIANQYVGFGFLDVDVINNNNEMTTTLAGKFYANYDVVDDNETTIKDQFTITKTVKS